MRSSEQTFLILTALAGEPRHGYGLISDVATLSDGEITLSTGTLYGILDRLGDRNLIEFDREERIEGRLRRYYRLTLVGRAELQKRAERQRSAARIALRRLEDAPAPGGAA